jgi:hypothetical protein
MFSCNSGRTRSVYAIFIGLVDFNLNKIAASMFYLKTAVDYVDPTGIKRP